MMGTGKGPAQGSKGADPSNVLDVPFFTIAPQRGKDPSTKGKESQGKGKNKGNDKGGDKGKPQSKGKNKKR